MPRDERTPLFLAIATFAGATAGRAEYNVHAVRLRFRSHYPRPLETVGELMTEALRVQACNMKQLCSLLRVCFCLRTSWL